VKAYEEVEVQLHLLLTSALDGGECSAHAPAAVSHKEHLVAPVEYACWAPEPVWTIWEERSLALARNRTTTPWPCSP
jgi:hypothetical protein